MHNPLTAQESIRSFYELYSDDIYRYAKLTLGDSNDAYDVVQEVFLRAFRSWDSYRETSSPRTWLMSIARNFIFDVFRKKRTQRKIVAPSEIPEVAIPESSAGIAVVAGCVGYRVHNENAKLSPSPVTTATSNTVRQPSKKPDSPSTKITREQWDPTVRFTNGEGNVKKLAKFHVTVPEVPKGYSMKMKLLQTTGYIPQQVWFTLSNGNEEEDITLQEFPRPSISPWATDPLGPSRDVKTIDINGTSVTMLLSVHNTYSEYRFVSNGMCYQVEGPVSPAKQVMISLIQTPKYLN